MQNIPIRTEEGREIRKAFIPRGKDRCILSADYSQIELRLLAHFSQDETLLQAFFNGQDIHRSTAAVVYGVEEDAVTKEMRSLGKTINFSIIYGKTVFGLARDLDISRPEAKAFIERYFAKYAKIKKYLDGLKDDAHKSGYVKTILGRRVYVPGIKSSKNMERQFAERAATNAPLQGSAAELIKKAMLLIEKECENEKLDALTVHFNDKGKWDNPD